MASMARTVQMMMTAAACEKNVVTLAVLMGNNSTPPPVPEPHRDQAQWLADSDNNAALVHVREHLQALEAEGQTEAKWAMESQLIAQAMEVFGLPHAMQDAAGSQHAITAITAYIKQLGWTWKEDTQEHSLPPTVHGTLQRAV